MKTVIAVTGASGFIGRSICRRVLAGNHKLRVLVRDPSKYCADAFGDAEVVPGDLADQEALLRLVSGVDAVVHCAGRVRGARQVDFESVNVDGTRSLLHAIKASESSPRLLLLSSLAAREPQLSFYASSKHQAELLLESEGCGVAWTVLRPSAVYGPGDREMLPLFRLMGKGLVFTPGTPTSRFSLLYVEDLSAAVISWLQVQIPDKQIFEIDDGHRAGYDWYDLSAVVGRVCNRKVRVFTAASWLLDFVALLNSWAGNYFGTAPMLTPEKLRELRHRDWVGDNSAFRQAADWRPMMSLAAGIRATPNWAGYRGPDVAA